LINRAVEKFDIDPESSWMVGDRYSDIELARNAGIHSAFVMTGYGRGEWEHQQANWEYQPELIAENLLEAVEAIGMAAARTQA
jgi:D-glycero-D-manno-heptose 1,7-bisphosphate phosphatase